MTDYDVWNLRRKFAYHALGRHGLDIAIDNNIKPLILEMWWGYIFMDFAGKNSKIMKFRIMPYLRQFKLKSIMCVPSYLLQ
jgi:hypothetical protein